MNKFFNILIMTSVIYLAGCVYPEKAFKEAKCPMPVQNCQPGTWRPNEQELAVDTSQAYSRISDTYYRFFRVKNINTPINEWCVSFFDNNRAALTFDDGYKQKVMLVRFTNDDRAIFQSGIGIPVDGSVGTMSIRSNQVVFSAKENEFVKINKDKNSIEIDKSGKLALQDGIFPSSDIFIGKIKDNLIFDVQNLSKKFKYNIFEWESQPAFSPEGNVIIFATDKPNEFRGVDLWFTVKDKNGNWSEPINCGTTLNSNCDELTPFITKDGTKILFSSNGFSTVGGYDIFESKISSQFWEDAKNGDLDVLKNGKYFSPPKNLKTPLNTIADELFPSTPSNPDELLYYSSNQSDNAESIILRKGGFDIYVRKKFTKVDPLASGKSKKDKIDDMNFGEVQPNVDITMPEVDLKIPQEFNLKGTVFNQRTKLPVPNAELVINDIDYQEVTDSYKIDTLYTRADNKGDFNLKLKKGKDYEITAQAPELFFESTKINIDKKNPIVDTTLNFFVPDELTLRINFPYDVYSSPYKYVLDSNGIETGYKWSEEVDKVVKNLKGSLGKIKKIILTGHTDDVGSDEYNYTLGLNRVKFLVNQLISRGIPKEMIEFSSKGKKDPLLQKENEDLNTYRKRLRRVEIQKVLI